MIEVVSLSRYYGAHRAVHDVSFRVESKSVVGFLGLNGAGKSTVLKVMAGILLPSAGTVRIDGVEVGDADVSSRRNIGYLPEDPPLHVEMTVSEYLVFLGRLRGMSHREVQERLPEVIATCQLKGQEDRVIGELSHGFRKRVGIAQAIIHRPSLVILDEPISGLDPMQIVEMRNVIRALGDQCTVLISSHNLPEISQTCDRILVLRKGHLVADGTEHTLAERFNTGRIVELTLTGKADAVAAFLDAHPDVGDYSFVGTRQDRLDVRVEMSADRREGLVAGLVGAGFGVRRLEDAQDELEEIFIDLNREGAA